MHVTKYESSAGITGNKFLLFDLGPEHYAVPLLRVQEIRPFTPVTRIPNAPPSVLGVMNLRGSVIAVIDMRQRFGQSTPEAAEHALVIVVNIDTKTYGLRVDSVSDVVMLDVESIQPAPQLNDPRAQTMISGVAQQGDNVIILVDLDEALNIGEFNRAAA